MAFLVVSHHQCYWTISIIILQVLSQCSCFTTYIGSPVCVSDVITILNI